ADSGSQSPAGSSANLFTSARSGSISTLPRPTAPNNNLPALTPGDCNCANGFLAAGSAQDFLFRSALLLMEGKFLMQGLRRTTLFPSREILFLNHIITIPLPQVLLIPPR